MPDNLINQLNQQKNLATHQARLLLSPEVHKCFDWLDISVVDIDEILSEFPWQIIDNKQIWDNVKTSDTKYINDYLNSMHKLTRIFQIFKKFNSKYCLCLENSENFASWYIPLTKSSLYQFILDFTVTIYNNDKTIVSTMKYNLKANDYRNFNAPDNFVLDNLAEFYRNLRNQNWTDSKNINTWLKQNTKSMYYIDKSDYISQRFVDSAINKDSVMITDMLVERFYWKNTINIDSTHTVTKKDINKKLINATDYNLDNGQYILSFYRFEHPIYIKQNEYQAYTLDLKPAPIKPCGLVEIDSIIAINTFGKKSKFYLYDKKHGVLYLVN